MSDARIVLSLNAHPDDMEFFYGGTMALLHKQGWQVHVATMTPGDCGSAEYNREEISRIRRGESKKAAQMIDGTYHCLECGDVFIMYDRPTLLKAIKLLRMVRPAVVFAPSPSDYMIDHEITSRIVQTACFAAGMPNIEIDGVEPFEPIPYLYYADIHSGRDIFGTDIEPSILVDVSSVMDMRERMLCCHASQRNWLIAHHGMDEYVVSMKRLAELRGRGIGVPYAEGFRQHTGHAYPDDNILKSVLGDLVHEK